MQTVKNLISENIQIIAYSKINFLLQIYFCYKYLMNIYIMINIKFNYIVI
jgi:hypothetical protein